MPPSRARYLLIDISNSFTKLAWSSDARLLRHARCPTAELTARKLADFLCARPVEQIVLASVVPARTAFVRAAAREVPLLAINARSALGVTIDYPKPHTIGADRLANAAAAAQLHRGAAIVVDFGTAVTFDVISAERTYLGGVIAPGLEAMTTFLYDRTALLPRLTLREPRAAVGKSTRAAMLAGAIYGYRGLVREILREIRREVFAGRKVRILATGGYAKLIAARLPLINEVVPHLTMEGLRIIGNLNTR